MDARYRPSDTVSLRRAHTGDVEAMASIELAAFSDPWPAAAFSDLLDAPHARIMVAVSEGDGTVGYCVLLIAADEGEIANIAVLTSHRGRGVGARLLDRALECAQHESVRSVYLEVRTSNHPARDLYASRAFVAAGRRRAYYRNPFEDALILRWENPSTL